MDMLHVCGLVVVCCLVIFISFCLYKMTTQLVDLYKISKKTKKEKKEKDDRERREEMLRILPQLNLQVLKRVIEDLGWVKHDLALNIYFLCLPSSDFASMKLIGTAMGSIIKNWGSIWNSEENPELQYFADLIGEAYSDADVDQLLIGIKTTLDNNGSDQLYKLINKARVIRDAESQRQASQVKLEEIMAAGLKAAGVKKQNWE